MKTFKILVGIFALAPIACSTLGNRVQVVERADSLSSTPEWASFTHPLDEAEGKKFFLGYIEVEANANKSAALNMADEKALSEPLRSVVSQFLDQNQVGEDLANSVGQRIISSTSNYRPPMADLRITKRYWEIVETRAAGNSSATPRAVLRAYSLAEVPVSELQDAKRTYLAKLRGSSEVKKILSDVGARQRDRGLSSVVE
jgi:hypothetical protein